MKLKSLCLVSAVAVPLLAGCAWSIGGHKNDCPPNCVHHCPPPPTRGQELIDLKKARDAGAINDEEYGAGKRRILEK
jgi:hypothetical protein